MKNKEKALIKDLELQIDFLIGYAPSGNHWKQEWTIREELIRSVLGDESTPEKIVDKILNIQARLYDLRNGVKNVQDYLQGQLEFKKIVKKFCPKCGTKLDIHEAEDKKSLKCSECTFKKEIFIKSTHEVKVRDIQGNITYFTL